MKTPGINSIDADSMNAIIRQCLISGKGFYTLALQNELKKRRIDLPFLAHDLMDELDGKRSEVEIQTFCYPIL